MILDLSRPLVSFDFETTGLDPKHDRIVELGMVKLFPGGRRESHRRLVDPGVDIPEAASRIHGIRNDDVRGLFGEPPLSRVAGEILEFIGDCDLAGFNVLGYDLPMWLAEVARYNLPFRAEGRHVLDARVIFVDKEPSWDRFVQGPRDLNNAVLQYCGRDRAVSFSRRDAADDSDLLGVSLDQQMRHSAEKDADAALDVLLAQLERYPDLPRTVPELGALCREAFQAMRAAR